jgi:POT family proton-dependent oligopeptide transporter
LIWVPVLMLWLYPLAERLGLRPTPLRRMGAGMLSAAVAFLICGWLQWRLESGEVLSLTWQLVPYVFLELGEVMVSATGLEYAYTQAPVRLKSTVMSLWLCTNAVGNLLVAVITNLNARFVHAQGALEFGFYALLMVSVVIVFGLVARRATGRAFRRRRPGTRR